MTTEQQKQRRQERAFKSSMREHGVEVPMPDFATFARDAEDKGVARVVYDALCREVQS